MSTNKEKIMAELPTAQEADEKADKASGRDSTVRLRRMRGQLLRIAADYSEDPLKGASEMEVLEAARLIKSAGDRVEDLQVPGTRS